jgi:DNA helicase-4
MPESHKNIKYFGVSLGLGLIFSAALLAFFSLENGLRTPNMLLANLSLSCLVCGLVFEFGGIAGIWADFLAARKSKLMERERIQNNVLDRIAEIKKAVNELTSDCTYLISPDKKSLISRIAELIKETELNAVKKVLNKDFVNKARESLNKYTEMIENYNQNFIQQRKKDYSYLWKKGCISLDDEQQTAIVTDDKYNLVVAAAGSGKTEVLITRISYLTARKPDTVNPTEILAIAYQNKDVKQIKRRLNQSGIFGVNVRTFHSLGLDILHKAGKLNKCLDKNERPTIIKMVFQNEMTKNFESYHKFLNYAKTLHESNEPNELAEKVDSIRTKGAFPYTALNNEQVKSRAEKEILDFILTNKLNKNPVKVQYEREIENVGKPDFYLPDYDLYIEHWGLTKNGTVPKWFDQSTEEYLRNKEKKIQWFKDKGKLLVETYTHEYDEDNPERFLNLLSQRITTKLQEKCKIEFTFELMSYEELVEAVSNSDDDWLSGDRLSTDLAKFIKNAKTYDLSPERILQKLDYGKWSRKQQTFGKLAVQIYSKYEEKIREMKTIDFEDMINRSIWELTKNSELCKNAYKHILVDEYQDITQQTNKLVKTLLKNSLDCKLFCVGDDWQSVMGFAGSNLEFFVNFEKHYDSPAITKIRTNYRSMRQIVDAGTSLMKNNENCQRQKTVVSKNGEGKLIKILRSPHQINYRTNYHHQIAHDCMDRVEEYLRRGYENKDILILSRFMWMYSNKLPRYHYIIENLIDESKERKIKLTDQAKDERRVRVLTVHKAKGLEAKVVFILNVIKDVYGFPCEIEDSSILEPARENYPVQDQKEEERRLFYVAMSRAKEDLNIYTWEPAMSEFLEEIKDYTTEERLNY